MDVVFRLDGGWCIFRWKEPSLYNSGRSCIQCIQRTHQFHKTRGAIHFKLPVRAEKENERRRHFCPPSRNTVLKKLRRRGRNIRQHKRGTYDVRLRAGFDFRAFAIAPLRVRFCIIPHASVFPEPKKTGLKPSDRFISRLSAPNHRFGFFRNQPKTRYSCTANTH